MAYDEGLTELMRGDLADIQGISEKKMFGGVAFMLNGNMVCGVHTHGGMYRVGKDRETAARAIDGAGSMDFTGRPMGGMINVTDWFGISASYEYTTFEIEDFDINISQGQIGARLQF